MIINDTFIAHWKEDHIFLNNKSLISVLVPA